jgi:hypothetical protein
MAFLNALFGGGGGGGGGGGLGALTSLFSGMGSTTTNKGGNGQKTGGNVGSIVGGICGACIGGPIGAQIGSSLVGALGGMLGGMFDKEKSNNPLYAQSIGQAEADLYRDPDYQRAIDNDDYEQVLNLLRDQYESRLLASGVRRDLLDQIYDEMGTRQDCFNRVFAQQTLPVNDPKYFG